MPSDFLKDLIDHRRRVAGYLQKAATELMKRAIIHDDSKFSEEEYEPYEEAFPELQKHAYGSAEFKAALEKIKPAIEHHYQVNRHHPEYHKNGINDMNLLDLLEMTCDWVAASERSKTGMEKGLEINKQRFHIDDQLAGIIKNTIVALGGSLRPIPDPNSLYPDQLF